MSEADLKKMPPGLAALMRRAGDADRKIPPVERWNPPFCGDLDIHIAVDGTWSYMGSAIHREALVKLFASVLRKDDDGRHYLVTPVEKIGISVDDVPFIGAELHVEGRGTDQKLTIRTNVGDVVTVNETHKLRFVQDADNHGLKPYVLVRGRLEARLSRSLLYELADIFEEHGHESGRSVGVWSCGVFFPVDGVRHDA